jgi:hypothetical protein
VEALKATKGEWFEVGDFGREFSAQMVVEVGTEAVRRVSTS